MPFPHQIYIIKSALAYS